MSPSCLTLSLDVEELECLVQLIGCDSDAALGIALDGTHIISGGCSSGSTARFGSGGGRLCAGLGSGMRGLAVFVVVITGHGCRWGRRSGRGVLVTVLLGKREWD